MKKSKLFEWVMKEDKYQEKLHIPVEIVRHAGDIGESLVCTITNLNDGKTINSRFNVSRRSDTEYYELYLPAVIQEMLSGSGEFRIGFIAQV